MGRRDRCTGTRSGPRSCGSGARAGPPSCSTSQPVNCTRGTAHAAHRSSRRAHLPAGEIEGWNSTFVNLFASVYRRILRRPQPGDELVATLSDGLFLMRVIEAVTRSSAERAWVDVGR